MFLFYFLVFTGSKKIKQKEGKEEKKREIVGFLLYKNSRKSLRFLLRIRHFLDFSII